MYSDHDDKISLPILCPTQECLANRTDGKLHLFTILVVLELEMARSNPTNDPNLVVVLLFILSRPLNWGWLAVAQPITPYWGRLKETVCGKYIKVEGGRDSQ